MKDLRTFRVGLVGAGNISVFHIRALKRLADVTLVGITDLDRARAEAAVTQHGVPAAYSSLEELVAAGAEVIHVLTPPASHATITLEALERGCHVFVEKPLATSVEDCDRIAEAAARAGKTVGVNHSMLCDPFVARARELVQQGTIGEVVSADYIRSQDYPPYPGGPLPPQYRTGGYPLRDMGVHALYLLEAFLGPLVDVQGMYDRHPACLDANLLYNEWRLLVRGQKGTGQVHLSWNIKPHQNVLIVQGTKGVVRADLFGLSVTVRRTSRMPMSLQRMWSAWNEARQMWWQIPWNMLKVMRGKILRYHGLQQMVADFYENLQKGERAPVTPSQAKPIVDWTERLARQADQAREEFLDRFPKALTARVLVTGATGFIGKHLLKKLLQEHDRVRIFVRRDPPPEIRDDPRVEVVLGDLGDPHATDRAVAGVELVYHLGAAMRGGAADFHRGTVVGTQNIVDSVLRHGVRRLVYISSLSVLQMVSPGKEEPIREDWPLEAHPDRRGLYTKTKLEAEQIVRAAVTERDLPAVILRPGQVFGPGAGLITPAVAIQRKNRLLILGGGKGVLPLVYVEDLVDAIVLASRDHVQPGALFHLVDSAQVTQNELARLYAERIKPHMKVTHLPRLVLYAPALALPWVAWVVRRPAPLSVYRLRSATTFRLFDCTAAREELGWHPQVGVEAGLELTLSAHASDLAPSEGQSPAVKNECPESTPTSTEVKAAVCEVGNEATDAPLQPTQAQAPQEIGVGEGG